MDPFIYQYAIGGIIFAVGILYGFKQDYLGTEGEKLRNLLKMFGGLAFFFFVQGYLQYAPMDTLPAVAYTGPQLNTDKVIGTRLDYAVMVGYFLCILLIGTWYGQNQKDTKDFFFGGQRFSWWLIAFSLVASVIGSYSFVKYSQVAWNHGLASSQTYLNDWFWLPALLFGWLPILYFTRLTSIPEYFEHRFGRTTRNTVTGLLLVYLIGYIGVNLFTMGSALNILLKLDQGVLIAPDLWVNTIGGAHPQTSWSVFVAACVVAGISAVYVTFGGQTAVIMTDLFQGVMLMATGLVLLVLAADHLGGFDALWQHLPRDHRRAFANFNTDPEYNSVGIFWQDAVANSAMFYFLNQGILMRFMAARSVDEGRKAAMSVLLILMPIAAIVVASGGWAGRALAHAGVLPGDMAPKEVFFITAEFLAIPGVFGLVLAALTAALMSTVDTLITAVAAVVVNDVVRPLRPTWSEAQLLKSARVTSISVSLFGVSLVPVFSQFDSIYAAHGAFTAAITPPMVVALLLGVFWRRFTTPAALATLIGGSAAICLSFVYPELIAPFAHGAPPGEPGDLKLLGIDLGGFKQYKFMRAFYGISVSAAIGVAVTLVTKPRPLEEIKGYVWGTVSDAIVIYKGVPGTETYSEWASTSIKRGGDASLKGKGRLPVATISRDLATALEAGVDDILFIADNRAWLGGLRSCHAVVVEISDDEGMSMDLGPIGYEAVVAGSRVRESVMVQRFY